MVVQPRLETAFAMIFFWSMAVYDHLIMVQNGDLRPEIAVVQSLIHNMNSPGMYSWKNDEYEACLEGSWTALGILMSWIASLTTNVFSCL